MSKSTIPLSGKLVKTVIGTICRPPYKGDDKWEDCSIGLAKNSVVATDGMSAILIGQDATDHVATQRKEALLESERASLYGDPVLLDDIERNLGPDGVILSMPDVVGAVRSRLSGMKSLGEVDPAALAAIGKVAAAAGATSVELFQPRASDGENSAVGFKFTFWPSTDHVTLFSQWEGPIEARGLFKATRGLATEEEEPQEELTEPGAPEPKRRARRKATQEAAAPEPEAEETPAAEAPEIPVDVEAIRMRGTYQLPFLTCLEQRAPTEAASGDYGPRIIEVLKATNLPGRIICKHVGPTVTLYELDIPAGTSVKKIAAMEADLQMQLGVRSVRIQAPIPGKKAIGIEIPNDKARTVSLFDLCARHEFVESEARLLVALGQDIAGRATYADLCAMPHLLIAGATNSGKSIGIATLLSSLLLRNTPQELRLILIDPKQVELSLFESVPHLMCPVVTEVGNAPGILLALVSEMERRYVLCKEAAVRNIAGYNAKATLNEFLPYIVVVIDELADLIMQLGDEAEKPIVMLAQKARAVGIHLVVATQKPSVDVITGMIKSNVPSRIAFNVASMTDSRVILDQNGAEKLLGKGDMLYSPIDGGGRLTRVQGAYASEEEVAAICGHWRAQSPPRYEIKTDEDGESGSEDDGMDPLYKDAVVWVAGRGQASTSMLQRRFSIGFQRASKLVDLMEERGVVGPRDGPRPRKVLAGVAQ